MSTSANPGSTSADMSPEKQIVTLRIIVMGLLMGALAFGVVAAVVVGPGDQADGTIARIGLLVGLAALVLHRIVGSLVLRSGTQLVVEGARGTETIPATAENLPNDEEAARRQLMAGRTVSTIVSCSLLESAIFLNLIAYGFMDGDVWSLAMACLLWLAMLLHFPLPGSLQGWMDRELRTRREENALGRRS